MMTRMDIKQFPHRGGLLVNPDKNWIWLKIGKTAGTSILRGGLEGERLLYLKKNPNEWNEWFNQVTDEELAGYTCWTIKRDPLSRLLSALAYFNIDPYAFIQDPGSFVSHGFFKHAVNQELYTNYADVIGKYENLEDDWMQIAPKIHVPPRELPYLNKTKRDFSGVSAETKQKLEEISRYSIKWWLDNRDRNISYKENKK